jgi:adenosine deaminase
MAKQSSFPNYPLAELHAHLGSSINPTILWQLAHSAGIKLPKKELAEFERHIMLSQTHRRDMETYLRDTYHPLLDNLSSGVHEVELATYHILSTAYHTNGVKLFELRNNPMKHNKGGLHDLDHIIMAMLRGMERALLECPGLSAGLILALDRQFTYEQNKIILNKAIKYHKRGVVGVDMLGIQTPDFNFKDYVRLFDKAREAGLGITVHTGEVKHANDMWEALKYIKPDRIGHGILSAYDPKLMEELSKRGIVLEVCPLSNIATNAVKDIDEMRQILRTLKDNEVRFCIGTDWPEIIEGCRSKDQFAFMLEKELLDEAGLQLATETAFQASFIPKQGGLEAYL